MDPGRLKSWGDYWNVHVKPNESIYEYAKRLRGAVRSEMLEGLNGLERASIIAENLIA